MDMQNDRRGVEVPLVDLEGVSDFDPKAREVVGSFVEIDGETYYRISNTHLMQPFFMYMVSADDHWLFIASNGALSAGRKNTFSALFPYYSADKLIDLVESTGPKTIVQLMDVHEKVVNWEPFRQPHASPFECTQNLYKNTAGTKVQFEEVNHSLGLVFRYSWSMGAEYGFVRTCHLANLGPQPVAVRFLDGLQNVLPAGTDPGFQLRFSNLGDAYKKNELTDHQQVGLFYLSSIPTDRAEPSEGLRATTVWQCGLENPKILLSNQQVEGFRQGRQVRTETDVRAQRGCYFVVDQVELASRDSRSWKIAAEVNQNQTDVVNLEAKLSELPDVGAAIVEDVQRNHDRLERIIASADGVQVGCDGLKTVRHRANTTFNLLRGGVPLQSYTTKKRDFLEHLGKFNQRVLERYGQQIEGLSDEVDLDDLIGLAVNAGDPDLIRIAREYLPLAYSRRHGDPTRPWNHFSIDIHQSSGSTKLQYAGNWRDLFQNWEALGFSYPRLLPAMILRFVNCSTADGYNPYRVTKGGFDWEKPDPADPWANIGYWGDHQIIYLLKLIEHARAFDPNCIDQMLMERQCVFANVPYRIGPFETLKQCSGDTIEYDHSVADAIEKEVDQLGADGQLLRNGDGPTRVTLLEKILLPGLVKMANLIPEGGVWLNTQRPEWNDANNALVGHGASMVTVCYMRRYFAYLKTWLSETATQEYQIAKSIGQLLEKQLAPLREVVEAESPLAASTRFELVERLQRAGEEYRSEIYNDGFDGQQVVLAKSRLLEFFDVALEVLDRTIVANRREDGLYHSYNLVSFDGSEIQVDHLQEMLEGQVAVLSSGALDPDSACHIMDVLRDSDLYRADQNSYLLYPNRVLDRFMEKNRVPAEAIEDSELLQWLLANNDSTVIRRDVNGGYHFAGGIRNSAEMKCRLEWIAIQHEQARAMVDQDRSKVCDLFEATFNHRQFTGRSGTFFGYEGLGSIYWHMVSKYLLAVLENHQIARQAGALKTADRIGAHYRAIRDGLGTHKSPELYGAFPTDPYSHTPKHAGAQQPGMTGQVKEDILTRFGELGIRIQEGRLGFAPDLFDRQELVTETSTKHVVDPKGNVRELVAQKGDFVFTFCQVPVVYRRGSEIEITVQMADGNTMVFDGDTLPREISEKVFDRRGEVDRIVVEIPDGFHP